MACGVTKYEYAFISNRGGTLDLYITLANSPFFNVTNDKDVEER